MRRLGWQVDEESFYTPADQTRDDRLQQMVRDRIKDKNGSYDFAFTVNFWPLLAPVLDDLGIRYVSWSYDAPLAFVGTPEMERKNNYIFLFDRGQVRNYKKQGITRVWHLPLASDPDIFSREIERHGDEFSGCGVSFIGSFYYSPYPSVVKNLSDHLRGYLDGILTAQRNLYGSYLLPQVIDDKIVGAVNAELLRKKDTSKDAGVFAGSVSKENLIYAMATRITCFDRLTLLAVASKITDTRVFTSNKPDEISGTLFKARVKGKVDYHTQMPVIFNRSRINLCPTLRCIETGIPLRALDIMACHGVVMMPLSEETAEYFENGTDSLLYSSDEEAFELMRFYLSHDSEIDRIRENAYEKIRTDFSFEKRLDTMARILKEN